MPPTADSKPDDALQFRYLPAYAQYLLDHKLAEFSAALLAISRELKIPLLRYFESLAEADLIAMGIEGARALLEAFAHNRITTYLEQSLRSWKENQLPLIQSNNVAIEDISKVNFSRRKAFRDFLPMYSVDPAAYIGIMEEVDRFTLTQEEISYKMLFEIKEREILEHHHFIDKIANTTPGTIYVFDLAEGKEIYSNHKHESPAGFIDEQAAGVEVRISAGPLHPDDLPIITQHHAGFGDAAEGEIRTIEFRVRKNGDEYGWQRSYETVFKRDKRGQPAQIIGIAIDISGEKEAATRLMQREQQLREAQEIAGMGSFEWDLAGNNTVLSPQLLQIFELEARSNLTDFLAYVHPSDRAQVKEAIAAALAGGATYESEYRYQKDGPEKVIWSRGKVSFEGDKAVRMKGTVMDVTLRHDMLKRLERSEQLHKQAQALTHIGNWSWALNGDKVEWSDEMYRIFGLEPQSEHITLARILSLLHPDDRAGRHAALFNAIATTQTEDYTMRVLHADGSVTFVEGKTEVLVDETGKPYKVAGTCQDITRQHLLHERLRESEQTSRELINNAPEAIVVIDEGSHILLWNPKAEATFGWTYEEVRGRTLMDTIIPEAFRPAHAAGIHRLQTTGVSRLLNQTIEVSALKKEGAEFYISLTISRSLRGGRPVYIAFIRDITAEKETATKLTEQRNQLAQKARDLERSNSELMSFNYIASHDLQEPVRKIRLFSNLISADAAGLPERVKDSALRISGAAAQMQQLIEALIAFSRTSTAERIFAVTDLNSILGEVVSTLKDNMEEEGAIVTAAPLPVLRVIPFQIAQLFENIIGNALKYSRPAVPPHIRISAEPVPGSAIEDLGADPSAAYCRISIADNGIGFDPQYVAKVFELFQRLHSRNEYAGTGIGLAICKKIVRNHEGFITAESRVGEGAAFHIYLPEMADQ